MRRKEAGQAFILVLILLAIGATLVVPALNLTGTSLNSSEIVTRKSKELYAADAAQEYVMWKLVYGGYASFFTYNGQEDNFPVNVCGTPVNVTVVMRAVASWRGVRLATDDVIMPTKTVSPTSNDGSDQTYTYTIRLQQISDNTSQGLDAVYDMLPGAFTSSAYVAGNSKLSIDGGPFQPVADPLVDTSDKGGGFEVRLRWPASGIFSSDPASPNYFYGIRDFNPEQVKELSFQVRGSMAPNTRNYNWVVLAPWNTLSGAQAPITRGTGAGPRNGLIDVFKETDTPFIQPDEPATIGYTIRINNLQQSTDKIVQIDDFLPPGFSYVYNSAGGITTLNPQYEELETFNGVERWHLRWTFSPTVSVASGQTLFLTFQASGIQSVSGSYYNEMMVIPDNPIPKIFSDLGITREDFNSSYTWNSAPVVVPAYDSSATAGSTTTTTTDANLGLTAGGVAIISYQIR